MSEAEQKSSFLQRLVPMMIFEETEPILLVAASFAGTNPAYVMDCSIVLQMNQWGSPTWTVLDESSSTADCKINYSTIRTYCLVLETILIEQIAIALQMRSLAELLMQYNPLNEIAVFYLFLQQHSALWLLWDPQIK